MTTLGRPESFRIAYQAVLHDLAAMTAERDALRADNSDALAEADAAHFGENTALRRLSEVEAERDALKGENNALHSEILTLRARLGNIADLTTMPMPPDWTKR